jgi:hypothetical protein
MAEKVERVARKHKEHLKFKIFVDSNTETSADFDTDDNSSSNKINQQSRSMYTIPYANIFAQFFVEYIF